METPDHSHIPQHILPKLGNMKPYIVLIYRKGRNYDSPDRQRIIQAEHLPYIFELREKEIILLSMPINDSSDIVALGIFNLSDKNEALRYVKEDPAVNADIFTFEILNALGMKSDMLK
ncbi:MAG: hypothetical protein AB2L14_27215 [Candidatus Xenobiia bacterium LiM19]